MTTLEVLLKARAEVEKGWCRAPWGGGFPGENHDGTVCAVGGVWRIAGENIGPAARQLEAALATVPGSPACVSLWNDRPSTTKQDVLALYDRAINAQVPVGDSAHVHRVS